MYTIGKRLFFQNFMAPLAISVAAGVGLVSLTLTFGYATTFWLVCGLTVAFYTVGWLLPIARSKLESLSQTLCWWHFLWLLVLLSGLVFRVRDIHSIQATLVDFWALYRILLMAIVAVILLARLIFHRTEWDRPLLTGLIGLLTAYGFMNLLSTQWSIHRMWTLYKSVEYLIDVALIAAVVASVKTLEEFKTLFDWNWVLLGLLTINVWLGVALWPGQTVLHRGLIGIQIQGALPLMETNSVGEIGALLGAVSLTRLLFATTYRRFYLAVFVVAIVTLIFSQSRSPLTGFFVALILILFAARRIGTVFLFVMLVPALLSLTSVGDIFWEFFRREQSSRAFESLSGRVFLWELGWDLFKKQPLAGYGAYAASRFALLTGEKVILSGSSMLNTWMDVLLGTGVIGLIPLVGAFVGTWMILLRALARAATGILAHRLGVEAMGVLAVLSVRSVFSTEFIWHPPLNFLLALGYAELLRRGYREMVYETPYRPQPIKQ